VAACYAVKVCKGCFGLHVKDGAAVNVWAMLVFRWVLTFERNGWQMQRWRRLKEEEEGPTKGSNFYIVVAKPLWVDDGRVASDKTGLWFWTVCDKNSSPGIRCSRVCSQKVKANNLSPSW
jgi:hypothetical protein